MIAALAASSVALLGASSLGGTTSLRGRWRATVAASFVAAHAPIPNHDAELDRAAQGLLDAGAGVDVRRRLRAEGVRDGLAVPVVVDGPATAGVVQGFEGYVRDHVAPQGVTRYGLATSPERVVLIFVRRVLEVEQAPRRGKVGHVDRIVGRLVPRDASAYRQVQLVVGRPDGRVDTIQADREGDRIFVNVPFFGGPGRYDCELVAQGPRGHEVLALWRLQAGLLRDPPEPAGPRSNAGAVPPLASPEAQARRLVTLLNDARKHMGLRPLRWDRKLARTARAQARAMAAAGMAAHVLPGGRGATERAERAGITSSRFYENVAMASSIEQAHEDLWGSPTHRLALIDPLVTHVGVGVASVDSAGGRLLFIAEHLAAR